MSSLHKAGADAGPKTLRLTSTAAYMRPKRDDPSALTTVSTYDSSVGSIQHEQGRELAIGGRRAVQQNDMVANAVAIVETRAVFGAPGYEGEFDAMGNKRGGGSTFSSSLGATAGSHFAETAEHAENGVPMDGLFASTLVACMNEKPPSIDDLAGGGSKTANLSSPAASPMRKMAAPTPSREPTASPMSPGALARLKNSQRGEPREPTVKVLDPVPKHGQEGAFQELVGILHADERHGIKSAITTEFFQSSNGMKSPQGEWMAATYYAQQGIRPLEGVMAVGKSRHFSENGYKLNK